MGTKKTCPGKVRVLGVDTMYQTKQTMDLQKLRPTYSQWRTPLGPAAESRKAPAPVPVPKKLQEPPKGKGGPLWQQFYNDAVARGHPMPEKLADTLLRSREYTLELEAKRHTTKEYTGVPKMQETVAANKGTVKKGTKPVLHDAFRCKALTLEGRRCGFKATCGEFCKKHSVAEKM
jgi:hypothetical protein